MSATKSTREVEVKGVNRNPKFPKFNSGALKLIDDSWINVSKSLPIDTFKDGNRYLVEIETNKGYDTIVGVVQQAPGLVESKPPVSKEEFQKRQHPDVERRISRAGVIQAAAQANLHLYAKDFAHLKELTKEYADFLLSYVEGK